MRMLNEGEKTTITLGVRKEEVGKCKSGNQRIPVGTSVTTEGVVGNDMPGREGRIRGQRH